MFTSAYLCAFLITVLWLSIASVPLAGVYPGKTIGERKEIAQGTGGRVATPGKEESEVVPGREIVLERGEGKESDPERESIQETETVPEKGGGTGIAPEKMAPGEESESIQGREMTIDKETTAENTDPSTGTGTAASLPEGAAAIPEAAVPKGGKVATTEDDTGLAAVMGWPRVQGMRIWALHRHTTQHSHA